MSLIKLAYFVDRKGHAEKGALIGAAQGAAGIPIGLYAIKKSTGVPIKDIHKVLELQFRKNPKFNHLTGKRAMIAGGATMILAGAGAGALGGTLIRKKDNQ